MGFWDGMNGIAMFWIQVFALSSLLLRRHLSGNTAAYGANLSQLGRGSISTNTASPPPTILSQLPFTSPSFKIESSSFQDQLQPPFSDITSPTAITSPHDLFRSTSLSTNQLAHSISGGSSFQPPGMNLDQFILDMGEGGEDMGIDTDPLLHSLQTLAEGSQFDEPLSDPQALHPWEWFDQQQ